MKQGQMILFVVNWCLLMPALLRADTTSSWPVPAPNVFYLQQFSIADVKPEESVWLLTQSKNGSTPQGVVYSTLASPTLRGWVSTLPPKSLIWFQYSGPYTGLLLGRGSPKGAKIDHHVPPGDLDLYGLSIASNVQAQFQDFYRFCRSKKVIFRVSVGPGGYD